MLSRDQVHLSVKSKKLFHFIEGDIKEKDLVQIDASVIVGALILLTLTNTTDSSIHVADQAQLYVRNTINIITADIVFPFAISAIVALIRNKNLAIKLMVTGFINLMVSIFLLAIIGRP